MDIGSFNLAVFLLAFLVGLFFSLLIRTRGLTGFFTYLLAFLIIGVFVFALFKGQSTWIENLTSNLEQYLLANPSGGIGFLAGVVVALIFRKKSST